MLPHTRKNNQAIVITGIGVVSPVGVEKSRFWESLSRGQSGVRRISLFDTAHLRVNSAAEISDFRPEDIIGSHGLRNFDRSINLVLCATDLALKDASFKIADGRSEDTGIVLGSTLGSIWSISEIDKQALKEGPKSIDPGRCPNVVLCSPASQISIRFGIKGFTTTVSAGFNSFFEALDYSMSLLRSGRIQHVLVGAVEELCEQTFKAFYRLGLLAGSADHGEEINAPFDRRRNGFILGEGAAVFLLETFQTAVERQAKIYGEITQFYSNHIVAPPKYITSDCFRVCQQIADDFLTRSEIDFSDVDFVSLVANSSVLGDALEAKMMNLIFGRQKKFPAASAIKSIIGESYSASGAFQLLGALYCLETGAVYPTLGYHVEDPRSPAPFLTTQFFSKEIRKCLVWSIGQGRSNYCLTCESVGI